MYRPVLVTPPATTPISLNEAKAHCRIDHSDDNNTFDALILVATSYADGWTGILGRCLVTQTWRQDFDRFNRCLRLPLYPVSAITSVKYDDTSDIEQTVAGSNYDLLDDDLGAFLRFKDTFSFPSIHDDRPAVRVTYSAGYANAAAVPEAIKHGLLLLISHWYENREPIVVGQQAQQVPLAVDALLAPYRRIRF